MTCLPLREIVVVLVGGLWLASACPAQEYPIWFLHQGDIPCKHLSIGYTYNSPYPDSSIARGFRSACENLALHSGVTISGGEAFWATEGGTYWMGSSVKELTDTAAFSSIPSSLIPLDTFHVRHSVVMLIGDSACLGATMVYRRRFNITGESPGWIETIPHDGGYVYAVGTAPEYFYESSSWLEAERRARLGLARVFSSEISAMQKVSREGQEIRNEELAVTLRDIGIVARWRDFKKNVYYVLARVARK